MVACFITSCRRRGTVDFGPVPVVEMSGYPPRIKGEDLDDSNPCVAGKIRSLTPKSKNPSHGGIDWLGGLMSEITPEVLISEEQIHKKVQELAVRISADYADCDDLLLVGILKGSFIFLSDLSRALTSLAASTSWRFQPMVTPNPPTPMVRSE